MSDAGPKTSSRWLRRVKEALLFLLLTVVAFWLFEGLCSVIWVSSKVVGTRLSAERLHTGYDAELGWASIPNVSLPDLYGPGVGLTTNAQGFRGPLPVSELGPGERRVICSGDSFTLGYGVGDLDTWCAQLGVLDARLQTVNMGQGGYGVDQAYLWYKRDGLALDHDAQVFAFIEDDLRRMLRSDFHGFGKPYLELEDGHLAIRNVPVPRTAYLWPWLTANRVHFQELRSYAVVSGLLSRMRPAPTVPSSNELLALLFAVLEDLQRMNEEKGSALLVVYLPTFPECLPGADDTLRRRLTGETARRGLEFLDVTPALDSLPPAVLDAMYLQGWPPARHLSARGHRLVAETLYPRVRDLLAEGAGP